MAVAFKMKIAIDISPLQSEHKVRGVGFYLEHLKSAMLRYFSQNEYIFFQRGEQLPNDTQVLHFPYFEPFFLARPIYKKYKTVVTVHDLTPIVFKSAFPRGIKGEIKWQMQRYSLRKAQAIITDSESSKKDILKYVGAKEEKVNVVYLAAGESFKKMQIPKEKADTLRKKYGLPDEFILYVGDVTWNKNLPRLLDAIKETKFTLVMVGKSLVSNDYDRNNPWNHDLNRINELIKDDGKIIRLGFVEADDLVSIYNIASLFIMPSLYEGFGLPILEAMSCGCPVITTKEGSLAEVAGNAAYFVDGYNVESITKGIQEVMGSKKLREELSKKGLENIKRFSWKKTAEETLSVYKKILSK